MKWMWIHLTLAILLSGASTLVLAQTTASNFTYPQSVFVDSQSGNIWVTDFDNNRVMRFDVSGLTGVVRTHGTLVPEAYALGQNYPNPFNPTTTFQFTIVNRQSTIVKVFDLLGRDVATLVNEVKEPGTYTVKFDARGLSSGVYLYRLQSGNFMAMKKMLVLK